MLDRIRATICRQFGHRWKGYSFTAIPEGGSLQTVHVCLRCGRFERYLRDYDCWVRFAWAPAMTPKEHLRWLERQLAANIMGWHIEQVRDARIWIDDRDIPMVAADLWHPLSNSKQAALVVKAAEEE